MVRLILTNLRCGRSQWEHNLEASLAPIHPIHPAEHLSILTDRSDRCLDENVALTKWCITAWHHDAYFPVSGLRVHMESKYCSSSSSSSVDDLRNFVARNIMGSQELVSTLLNDMDSQKLAENSSKRRVRYSLPRKIARLTPTKVEERPTRIGRQRAFLLNPKSALTRKIVRLTIIIIIIMIIYF